MELEHIDFEPFDRRNSNRVQECATLMSGSEPWITLRRTYDDAVKIIMDETSEMHLAKTGDEMIGFAIIKMRGAFIGYIQSIVVKSQHRRQGVGKRFMQYLECRIFREQPNVFICVSSFNRGAKRLYEKLGYKTVGELKDYIVQGHSEILMRKSRAPLSGFEPSIK